MKKTMKQKILLFKSSIAIPEDIRQGQSGFISPNYTKKFFLLESPNRVHKDSIKNKNYSSSFGISGNRFPKNLNIQVQLGQGKRNCLISPKNTNTKINFGKTISRFNLPFNIYRNRQKKENNQRLFEDYNLQQFSTSNKSKDDNFSLSKRENSALYTPNFSPKNNIHFPKLKLLKNSFILDHPLLSDRGRQKNNIYCDSIDNNQCGYNCYNSVGKINEKDYIKSKFSGGPKQLYKSKFFYLKQQKLNKEKQKMNNSDNQSIDNNQLMENFKKLKERTENILDKYLGTLIISQNIIENQYSTITTVKEKNPDS